MPLTARRIVITGGSSGIGRALVRAYARHGAEVWAVARRPEALADAVDGLPAGRAHAVAADLTTAGGCDAVAQSLDGGALDVVVHAAGMLGPKVALSGYPADAARAVLEANLLAVHSLHRALTPYLARSSTPAVIGVSSSVGRKGRGGWGFYAVSKHALEGWLEVLADEFDGKVYSVNPGGTATPMRAEAMPEEDPATIPAPEDIVPVFLRLAHPACPEASGTRFEARDWIGRDPWEGIESS